MGGRSAGRGGSMCVAEQVKNRIGRGVRTERKIKRKGKAVSHDKVGNE